MSLVDVHATVNIKQVVKAFERIEHFSTRKVFSDLRGPARFDQRHHWRKEEAPNKHWPGLAPSTLERRTRPRGIDRKSGKRRSWPTKLLGRFPTALQMIASAESLIVRSRVKRFDMIHQAGGRAGHGARIPQRQYLWISKFLMGQVVKYFEVAMAKAAARTV